jgi:hypothetical protein
VPTTPCCLPLARQRFPSLALAHQQLSSLALASLARSRANDLVSLALARSLARLTNALLLSPRLTSLAPQSLKIASSREATLEDEQRMLETEEAKLHAQIAIVKDTAHEAAEAHEAKLEAMHPKIEEFENEAVKHKSALEALLLDVNLTTGLFKKREFEVSAVEKRLEKTRSARAQIEMERRMNENEYASLNMDSKRNSKILDVVMKANDEVARVSARANRGRERSEREDQASLLPPLLPPCCCRHCCHRAAAASAATELLPPLPPPCCCRHCCHRAAAASAATELLPPLPSCCRHCCHRAAAASGLLRDISEWAR